MVEKFVLTNESGSKTIQEIVGKIQSIAFTANAFHEEIKDVYDKSDLAFLKRVSKSLGELEAASSKLIENFINIDDTLIDYNKARDNGLGNTIPFKEGVDYGREG